MRRRRVCRRFASSRASRTPLVTSQPAWTKIIVSCSFLLPFHCRFEGRFEVIPSLCGPCASAAEYAKVLGTPPPRMYKGTVIMSHMAVFQLGPAGLTIAHPYAPGPAADALERRGPGPFQALYRTTSMGAAAWWMEQHGMPKPAIGTRDTGEKAMLISPADACGAYIGFVGPA